MNTKTRFTLPSSSATNDILVSENIEQTLSNKKFKDSNNVEYTIDDIPKLNTKNTFTNFQTINTTSESDYTEPFIVLAPNLTSDHGVLLKFGRTNNRGNCSYIEFHWYESNNVNNYVGIGIYSYDRLYRFYRNRVVFDKYLSVPAITLNGTDLQTTLNNCAKLDEDNTFDGKIESTQTTANNVLGDNLKKAIFDLIYPIGSLYVTMNKPTSSTTSIVNEKVVMTLYGCSFELLPSETFIMNIKYELSSDNTDYSVKIDSNNTGGNNEHTHNNTVSITNASHTLTEAQIPSHMHDCRLYNLNNQNFTMWTNDGLRLPNGVGEWVDHAGKTAGNNGAGDVCGISSSTGGNQGHVHNNTVSITNASASNIPPYLTCYIWQRIA